MLSNRRIRQILTGCLVFAFLSFFTLPSSAAGPPFNVVGTWYWAQGNPTTNAANLPAGSWTGTFTIEQDPSGNYTGTFSDKGTMQNIQVGGSKIAFTRNVGDPNPGPDLNGSTTQTWGGTIEDRQEGGLRITGKWNGAYDYLPKENHVSDGFLAVLTHTT